MKFDLHLHSNEDIDYFKTMFLRNTGIDRVFYYFYSDNIQVRIQVSGLDNYQLISIGIFDYFKNGSTTTINQFCPLSDDRFKNFEIIQDFWYYDTVKAWATFSHSPEEVDWALWKVSEILHIVYKVNNLKAFL